MGYYLFVSTSVNPVAITILPLMDPNSFEIFFISIHPNYSPSYIKHSELHYLANEHGPHACTYNAHNALSVTIYIL